jgi:hypothetical protein
MRDKSAEYIASEGWSSKLFASTAIALMGELKARGIKVTVGRSVIHIGGTIKAYVHHNGRTAEYATFTDGRGTELATFHYTEAEGLKAFVHGEFK